MSTGNMNFSTQWQPPRNESDFASFDLSATAGEKTLGHYEGFVIDDSNDSLQLGLSGYRPEGLRSHFIGVQLLIATIRYAKELGAESLTEFVETPEDMALWADVLGDKDMQIRDEDGPGEGPNVELAITSAQAISSLLRSNRAELELYPDKQTTALIIDVNLENVDTTRWAAASAVSTS
jgi:hypothetical protein